MRDSEWGARESVIHVNVPPGAFLEELEGIDTYQIHPNERGYMRKAPNIRKHDPSDTFLFELAKALPSSKVLQNKKTC